MTYLCQFINRYLRHLGNSPSSFDPDSFMGKFRAPTLRNIALTAPYMHDGSIATLEEVLDHYAAGGRSCANPQTAGPCPSADPLITGFELTPEQERQLIAFLQALTDQTFIHQALEQARRMP
jgi:cytochrome c peroxidase